MIGIVSARPHDANVLIWSDLDDYLTNLCEMSSSPICCFHGDNGFLGGWNCIRTPHRGTLLFPLNNRLRKENVVMKKIRVRVEWFHGMIKSMFKLVDKCLFF